jgi:hypothetical protein
MGADYLFGVKNTDIWAPAIFKHDKSSKANVRLPLFNFSVFSFAYRFNFSFNNAILNYIHIMK